MATWQSELTAELKSVIKGFEEGRAYAAEMLPKAKQLISEIENGTKTEAEQVAHELIDLKLNYFASKLLGGGFQDQAELNNQAAPLEVEHDGTDTPSSTPSTDTSAK